MSRKMFENNLGPIRKSKVTSTINKPAYVGISILDLDKLLMNPPIITLKINMVTTQDYYSHRLVV